MTFWIGILENQYICIIKQVSLRFFFIFIIEISFSHLIDEKSEDAKGIDIAKIQSF